MEGHCPASEVKPPAAKAKLSFFEKIAYGLGGGADSIMANLIFILAYPVYQVGLGIDARLIGLAVGVPRLWDALVDPVIGSLSDNAKNRWGRRKPFILLGAILTGLVCMLMWMPPTHWGTGVVFGYFFACSILYFSCFAMFSIPYNALGFEMSDDYDERTSVMSYKMFFTCFVATLALPLAFPMCFWFGPDKVSGVRVVGVLFGVVMILFGVLPAGGYKTFCMRPGRQGKMPADWSSSLAQTASIRVDDRTLENEFLRVTFNNNGTFDLAAKKTGQLFSGLNYYQDRGEAGDFWINQPPASDKILSSLGCSAKIWFQDAGPLQATVVSEMTMDIPSRLIRGEQKRSDDIRPMTLRTAVTLNAGSEQVDVHVTLNNTCQDHCLRVMFPTDIAAATHADAGGHFVVDRRSVRPQGPNAEAYWPDMATLPTNNFVDVSDGSQGVAFLHNCFTEYEISQDNRRTVALTLIKAVQTWICTESRVGSAYPSQKAGQCFGEHEYRYAIRPHAGTWKDGDIVNRAEMFNVPVAIVQTNKHCGVLPPNAHSLFSISNSLIRCSALKRSEHGKTAILRLYNSTDTAQKAVVRFGDAIAGVWETDLNAKRLRTLGCLDKHEFSITMAPHKIATYEIER